MKRYESILSSVDRYGVPKEGQEESKVLKEIAGWESERKVSWKG